MSRPQPFECQHLQGVKSTAQGSSIEARRQHQSVVTLNAAQRHLGYCFNQITINLKKNNKDSSSYRINTVLHKIHNQSRSSNSPSSLRKIAVAPRKSVTTSSKSRIESVSLNYQRFSGPSQILLHPTIVHRIARASSKEFREARGRVSRLQLASLAACNETLELPISAFIVESPRQQFAALNSAVYFVILLRGTVISVG